MPPKHPQTGRDIGTPLTEPLRILMFYLPNGRHGAKTR